MSVNIPYMDATSDSMGIVWNDRLGYFLESNGSNGAFQ